MRDAWWLITDGCRPSGGSGIPSARPTMLGRHALAVPSRHRRTGAGWYHRQRHAAAVIAPAQPECCHPCGRAGDVRHRAAAARQDWLARLRRDPSNRLARLGVASFARLAYDYAAADSFIAPLLTRSALAPTASPRGHEWRPRSPRVSNGEYVTPTAVRHGCVRGSAGARR